MLHSRTQVSRFLLHRPCQQLRAGLATSQPSGSRDSDGNLTQRTGAPNLTRLDRTAYVRTTKFLESLADAFALIRAIERKYGAVTEYRFVRDFEIGTKYQTALHVTFRDSESINRIPAGSDALQVPAPLIVQDRPGGIGLDELEGLLERQEYVKEAGLPAFENVMDSVLQSGGDENDRIIEFTIMRSRHQVFANNRAWASAHYTRFRDITAHHFINWGGFHDIKPIKKGTPMPDEDLFGTSPLDHIRMRRALRRWSEFSDIPNPYEYTPDSEQVTRADHVEWEPLPEHVSAADESPIPSSDEATSKSPHPLPTAPLVIPSNFKTTPTPPSTAPEQKLSDKPSPPMSSGGTQPEDLGFTNMPAQISSATLRKPSRSDVSSSFIEDKKATQLKAARNLVRRAQGQGKKPTSTKPLDSKPTPSQDSRFTQPPDDLLLEKRASTATERLKGFIKALF